ncbi:MAG: polysaccharide biosynthesis/export family protein, partial [Myxococcota bacterium]
MVFRFLALAFATSLGCGGSDYQDRPPVPSPETAPAASLGIGDVFEVRVFNEADLSGTYRVNVDGFIAVPLAGPVKVVGLAPGEIGDLLEERLADYLK